MKLVRRGFTIVEVSIFLAITGLLFVGITAGVQNSIYQQRYTDAVMSFADFLRNVYDEVLNVQNLGKNGRSDYAIYGKMVVFEPASDDADDSQKIRTYNLVGKAKVESSEESNLFELLEELETDVFVGEGGDRALAGIIGSYTPRWGVRIQEAKSMNDYRGVILVVRHPNSGKVYTAVSDGEIALDEANLSKIFENNLSESFNFKTVDFCVNPNGKEASNARADVRIEANASNASGVEIIMDGDGNECNGGGA